MMDNVKTEVAFEIMAMRIALAIENNNIEELMQLKKEREKLYEGNQQMLEKVYNKYSKQVKAKFEEEKNGQ